LGITEEEKTEIRKGAINIGARVSLLIFSAAALVGGGKLMQKVDTNQESIKENRDGYNRNYDELRDKYEKIAEDNRYLQTQIHAMNIRARLKEGKE